MARRYLHEQKTSFWEIERRGASIVTREGSLESPGQWRAETYSSEDKSIKTFDRLCRRREKRGWRRSVEPSGISRSHHPTLEAAIRDDPRNPENRLVYADHLQSLGNPRGQLITLQHALLSDPHNDALKSAKDAWLDTHRDFFYGSLMAHQLLLRLGWQLGFIHRAFVGAEEQNRATATAVADALDQLLSHPSSRFLHEVTIGIPGWIYPEPPARPPRWYNYDAGASFASYGPAVDVLSRKGDTLRSLSIGDTSRLLLPWNDNWERNLYDYAECGPEVGDLDPLWSNLTQLETLVLQGGSFSLGSLCLPRLQRLDLRSFALTVDMLDALAEQTFGRLDRLVLWFGDSEGPLDDLLGRLMDLLTRSRLPALAHLGLVNAPMTDVLCDVVAHCELAPQLRCLDLSLGTMTDRGATALLAHRKRFERLQELNVSYNALTAARNNLKGLCAHVTAHSQLVGTLAKDPSIRSIFHQSGYESELW